ncbi:hypothetical protein [Sulfurovum mangrovi]|uniref:hypothetical protein n=1 Tax=Sulfurovum mangrovi TaxID=2893889 RepID=UPI001E4A2C2B|nr:hypothetical protein [Sulfurovum mangrovi]UFH59971.1 hypothetical protein LN246_03770 [Sulfurovum mangrovi]
MKYTLFILIVFLTIGCYRVGHEDFMSYKNARIGKKIHYGNAPDKYHNSGELIRGDFLKAGQGLTHITKDKNGNLVYHIESAEVLPNFQKKEWVGKCKLYYVVDPKTKIIKSWGFDKGGNPQSCRTWP